jgi:tetratricopeptide (TPR) repeat protein
MRTDDSRLALYLALGLTLLTLVAYLPSLDNGFVGYDDRPYVTENPHVQAGVTAAGLRWAATAVVSANWHPLTLLSHMVDCQLFGLNPRGHHLTSLVLHLAAVLLLFAVLRRMTGAALRSAAVAALFAVHPTHVESVAWVAERKDVLCGCFWMLTLAAYLGYVRRRQAGGPWGLRYLGVAGAFVLALLAKPMAVSLPFVLLLLDVWPLARLRLDGRGRRDGAGTALGDPDTPGRSRAATARDLVVEKLPLFALAAAASAVALRTQAVPLASSAAAPLGLRVENALIAYVAYLGKTLFPARLAVFYPFPAEIALWKAIAAAALLAGLTLVAVLAARRAPYLAVGWLWYLGTLVPVIGVLQVGMQGMADRYTYLPSIGLYLATVWGGADLVRRRLPVARRLAVAATGLLLLLGLLTVATRVQAATWRDPVTLFRHALAVEDSYLAHTNLAEELRGRGDRAGALAHYRAALALEPRNAQAHAALGGALRSWGQPAAALPHLAAALALEPRDERARITLAMAWDDLGRPDRAIAELRQTIAAHPASARAHYGLADLLQRRGELAEARRQYALAQSADPELKARPGVR